MGMGLCGDGWDGVKVCGDGDKKFVPVRSIFLTSSSVDLTANINRRQFIKMSKKRNHLLQLVCDNG